MAQALEKLKAELADVRKKAAAAAAAAGDRLAAAEKEASESKAKVHT